MTDLAQTMRDGGSDATMVAIVSQPCPANDRSQAYFEIYRVIETQVSATRWMGGEWRWRFCAAAGETIALSCGYATSEACLNAAAALRRNAGEADIYQLA